MENGKFICTKISNVDFGLIFVTYLPSDTLGMKLYLTPDGKPAPPLPLSPEALISSTIQSGPLAKISAV